MKRPNVSMLPGEVALGRFVTIFTDASFDHKYNAGGYGYWFKSNTMVKGYLGGGAITHSCMNVSDTEFTAMVHAIYAAHKVGCLPGTCFYVECDNEHAGAILTGALPPCTKRQATMKWFLKRLCFTFNYTIRYRHVKGHYRGKDKSTRHFVNEKCDHTASLALSRRNQRLKGRNSSSGRAYRIHPLLPASRTLSYFRKIDAAASRYHLAMKGAHPNLRNRGHDTALWRWNADCELFIAGLYEDSRHLNRSLELFRYYGGTSALPAFHTEREPHPALRVMSACVHILGLPCEPRDLYRELAVLTDHL